MLKNKIKLSSIKFRYFERGISSFSQKWENVFLKVQHIDEIPDDIPILHGEINYYSRIKSENRMCHYLKSRKMIKNFISEALSIPLTEINLFGGVKYPIYCLINGKKIFVSLSHRDTYIATSFSSECLTGIDIEKFEDVNLLHLSDFLYDFELNDKIQAIMSWSIKESFLKMIGKGLSVPARFISVYDNALYCDGELIKLVKEANIKMIEILVFKYIDYVISLSLGFGCS